MSVREQVNEVLALLCARFPKTFFAYQVRRRPLKIGIHHDLDAVLDETVERKLLHGAMRRYTGNHGYLRAQQVGAERIDLDGNPAGVVTEAEAENARKSLAGINAKRREIKKQKQKQKQQQKQQPKPEKPEPKRDGLAALREAATRRRQTAGGAA